MLEEEEEDEDDGILEEEEEEDEDEIEAEDEADDSGGEEDDTAAVSNNQAAINNNKLLTNIIEDDEEHNEIHASSLLSNRAAFAPGQSNSRRSSRGAALGADSMISSLTIPEEVDELDSSSAAANAAAAAAAVADLASHRHHFEVTHIKVHYFIFISDKRFLFTKHRIIFQESYRLTQTITINKCYKLMFISIFYFSLNLFYKFH